MEGYQYFAEAVLSIALLITLVIALRSGFQSAQKSTGPLKVERIIFHNKSAESRYMIVIKNTEQYPVSIKSICCHTKASYKLGKINQQNTVHAASLADNLFVNNEPIEIEPNSQQTISVLGKSLETEISKLRFMIETSDRVERVWCASILTVHYPSIRELSLEERGLPEPVTIFGPLPEKLKVQPTQAIRLQDLAQPRVAASKK